MNAVIENDTRISGPVAGPVSGAERMESLDMLRGVAVLGILVMNIYAFAMPFLAYMNPYALGGTEPWNLGTWFVTHALFDQKFMSIFSMLFGAGMVLMMDRAEARDAKFGRIYYRRLFWLLLMGAVHAYLIWFGDILFFYALTGMIVFIFRHRSPRALIVIACLMLPVAALLAFAGGTFMEELRDNAAEYTALADSGEALSEEQQAVVDEWAEARAFIVPGEEELNAELAAYRGSYSDMLGHRVPFVSSFHSQGFFFFILWRVGGLMVLGMAFMKLGIFTAQRSTGFYRNLTIAGYALGLPLTIYSGWNLNAHNFEPLYAFRIGNLANYVGSILVAFGHIGAVMLIAKSGVLSGLMQRFAAVGRMALSNYLAHSIVMTTIFYSYGLGLYGDVARLWQMAFVVGLVGLQLLWSPWWLARYHFGPFEWLWRTLTYWQRQPMRRDG